MNKNNDLLNLWNKLLPSLEKSLNKPIYEALISSTKPIKIEEGRLEIAVPNDLVKDWLSKHCVTLMEQEAQAILPTVKKVFFFVGAKDLFITPLLEETSEQESSQAKQVVLVPHFLNPRYTFDTFVVGHGNRFAHAAALAVAEAPAKAYNPLFLYGGVGLGKTHLMQAIGRHVATTNQKSKILYITSETFTNDLISSIRDDKVLYFRNKYRGIDVLLVDDVQFIAGKERTQEEFFHTFNALYDAGKQIVVSSDRPPKEIPTLEARLRSRFEWGLTADIAAPDFETRIAILQKKASQSSLDLPGEIFSYIASKVQSNVRELEGALIRVVAFASLTNSEISLPLVDEALKDVYSAKKARENISLDLIKRETSEYFNVSVDDLSAKIRTKEIAQARQVAMYLARELTSLSLPKVGDGFGGRDHTTVLHACEKMKVEKKKNLVVQEAIKNISTKLKSYSH